MTYQFINNDEGVLSSIKLTEADGLLKFIPLDPENTDYQVYLAWVEEGGVPQAAG